MERLVKPRIEFRRRDGNLITNCYRNPPVRPINHNIYKCHKDYVASPGEGARPLISTTNEELLNNTLRRFIKSYFPDNLKKAFLNKESSFVLHHCTNLLLHHECDDGIICREHLTLIMKFRILARTSTSRDLIHRDIKIFLHNKLSPKLMAIYFMKFIVELNLMSVFFKANSFDVTEFLDKSANYIIPYCVTEFDPYTHYCISMNRIYLLELFIKYGARNLDIHQHPYYEAYRKKKFFEENIFINIIQGLIYPDDDGLIIDSRIKMRVLQVFIWTKFSENAMKKLSMSHLEPFLTKQEYEDTFKGFAKPPLITKEQKAIMLRVSWNKYKSIFKIEDNAQVTPRSLQDVCRYFIRLNLSSNGKLPDGVKLLWIEKDKNPFERYLTNKVEGGVQNEFVEYGAYFVKFY